MSESGEYHLTHNSPVSCCPHALFTATPRSIPPPACASPVQCGSILVKVKGQAPVCCVLANFVISRSIQMLRALSTGIWGQPPNFTILEPCRTTYPSKSCRTVLGVSDNLSGLNDLGWLSHNCKIGGLSPTQGERAISASIRPVSPLSLL